MDFCASTVDRGLIIYRVAENKSNPKFSEHPISSSGTLKRISSTGAANVIAVPWKFQCQPVTDLTAALMLSPSPSIIRQIATMR